MKLGISVSGEGEFSFSDMGGSVSDFSDEHFFCCVEGLFPVISIIDVEVYPQLAIWAIILPLFIMCDISDMEVSDLGSFWQGDK